MTKQELQEKLNTPGSKVSFQMSKDLRLLCEDIAGFTDEELEIFRLRTRGMTVVQIASILAEQHDKYYCISTIEKRISSIKEKLRNSI